MLGQRFFNSIAGLVLALLLGSGHSACAQETPVRTQETPARTQETPNQSQLSTVAELSGFRDTANANQVANYLRALASSWDAAELTTIGTSVEGRPLWALVVEPQVKQETKPITVLMLGGIHSGECDGKEALLDLAADMARDASSEDKIWWHPLRLIFVPNFNADGNERRGKLHRPGQAGPEAGMGIRENAQDLDLNRDFVKLESPEVRSLVAAISAYDVDVLIDTHTTNGSLHRYELTYDIPHTPTLPPSVDSYLRRDLIPAVTQRVADDGFSTFYYGNFDSAHRRWDTYGHEPRYSTEYMGLRGRIGILSESYSYVSYETRIRATYAFVHQVVRKVAEDADSMRAMFDAADQRSKTGLAIQIRAELAKTADDVLVKGFQDDSGMPPKGPYNSESAAKVHAKDYSVQLWNRVAGTEARQLPVAYAVDDDYAWAVSRLVMHGVQVKRLTAPVSVAVERMTVEKLEQGSAFQGHALLSLDTSAQAAQEDLAVGTYIIESTQPLGTLAAYFLEPDSDDSLAKWNFFDPDITLGGVYPVRRVLEPLPSDQLQAVEAVEATERLTLSRIMQPGKTVNYGGGFVRAAAWLKDSSEYVIAKNNRTYAVDAATGAMRPMNELNELKRKLAALDAFTQDQADSAARISSFSDDWKHALIPHNQDLYYFDAQTEIARQLTHSSTEAEQLATLSPTGKHVAFVRDNNLWVVDCETTELKQLTKDGSTELLNGILDWVYQEELYGRGNFKSFWWSPDGSKIAFLQLDQTPVPSYQVSDSISFGQSLEATRYPKAGEPLPTVRVWIAEVASGQLTQVDLSGFPAEDRLVARVSWAPQGDLWLQVFNRIQNKQDLVRVSPGGRSSTLLTEVSPGWIEVRGTPEFLPSGDFLWLSDLPAGHTHLFRVSAETGQKTQLTRGDWDVDSLLSVSSDHKYAFVSGNISNAIETHLISVDVDSGAVEQITRAPGSHRASVDASGGYYIDTFSSLETPAFCSVHTIDGTMLRVVEATTSDRHEYLDIRSPQLLTIPARDGTELQAMIMLPADFDPDEPARRLPVLFHVYGGPQAPTIRNSWQSGNYWWHQMLCQQGFAVVLCDNRAARGRGINDTWTIRGDMGRVELQDLEDAVGWVRQQPWADSENVGVWGWSYGGYFTSFALTHSKLFKAGIAGAPVTDWRNYDAIYTERYMDLPKDNEAGYKSSSSVEAAANLHGQLLIIHGERDDNVHISNSLQLAYALQKVGKQFELMVYPKNRHGIVDADQRFHMYQMMTNFLERHLKD